MANIEQNSKQVNDKPRAVLEIVLELVLEIVLELDLELRKKGQPKPKTVRTEPLAQEAIFNNFEVWV